MDSILIGKASTIRHSFTDIRMSEKEGNKIYEGLIFLYTSRDTGNRGLATARTSCHGIWSRDVPRDVTYVEVHSP